MVQPSPPPAYLRSALRKEEKGASVSLAVALIDFLSPGGKNLQKAVMLGCYFPLSEG